MIIGWEIGKNGMLQKSIQLIWRWEMRQQYIWESANLLLQFAKFSHFYTLQLISSPNIPQNYCKTGEEDIKVKIQYLGLVLRPLLASIMTISKPDQFLWKKTDHIKY